MRALIFLLPGLGDALTASPIISAASRADWRVDASTMLGPVAEYAASLPGVAAVDRFDLLAGPIAATDAALRLRRRRYDLAILPFPATRWEYHAFAAAVGARAVAAHDYGGSAAAIDRLAGATLTPLCGGHRVWENVRLAQAIGLPAEPSDIAIPAAWRGLHIPGLLGVHPGTMRYKGNEHRRWPLERFGALIARNRERGRAVRVFVGPDERDAIGALAASAGDGALEIVDAPLDEAARRLAECEVFVGNDAGFAHVAGALGVKTVVLFGMSDPVRAQPIGRSIAVRPSACPPCHDEGLRRFDCALHIGYRCIVDDLTVDDALHAIDSAFEADVPVFTPRESGPYRLYGRLRANTTSSVEPMSQSGAKASDKAAGA